ncbi:hypothetical protein TPAR_00655 [Tolypocladium paradoxum]|uniref:Choline transport protein n=1 Tax=Tolypocladium paradoxum TaxID=94208 RepID=A0A2S4L9L6_9HYPO|nr:hypothetical protein TPAR_00655 [Tolypocladium paradoxum]
MSIKRNGHELSDMGPAQDVNARVEGTCQREYEDRLQLARLGKKSVLKRNFSFMTILGFSCAVLVTWEGSLMNFNLGLVNGGPAGMIYGFIMVWIGNLSVFSTLSELVSMAPTSGGQYHWVSMLAPRSCSKFLSYTTGWLTLVGWQGTAVSGAYLAGSMLQGLITFTIPSHSAKPWQVTLTVWGVVLIAVLVNTVVSSMVPKLEGMILVLHILGFFAVFISLVTFGSQGDTTDVFGTFRNGGNWPTQTLSCFVGLLGLMCEEVQNPSIAVPRSIMSSIAINGAMGLAMLIAMNYGATDLDKAQESPTGYAFIEIFYQATGSKSGSAGMAALIIFMTISAVVGVIATTSRMFWAFARDRGLPFWRTLSKVNTYTSVPVWAISVTSVISCLLALIDIGSSVAYNALVSVAISGLYSSYLIVAGLLLYRRCTKGFKLPDPSALPALADTAGRAGQELIWGPWHIPGVFGIINNSFACIYLIFIWFFSFWPPATPVEASTMNFSVLMTGAVIAFSILYYLARANREYKGPIVEI